MHKYPLKRWLRTPYDGYPYFCKTCNAVLAKGTCWYSHLLYREFDCGYEDRDEAIKRRARYALKVGEYKEEDA